MTIEQLPAVTVMPWEHLILLDMTGLQIAADLVNDLEQVRMASAARYGALTGLTPAGKPWTPDKDGVVRTADMDPGHPAAVRFLDIYTALAEVEARAVKNLERVMKAHPLGPWVQGQRGLGLKQAARLLATIGDPYWRDEIVRTDEDGSETSRTLAGPRTVSALWAYCGEHIVGGTAPHTAGVAARRKKGVRSNWSTAAKTRAWLCAESCVKQIDKGCKEGGDRSMDEASRTATLPMHHTGCACSPFRVAYDRRKVHTIANRPDWTDGHRHTDAMRITAKAILKELWREARRLHLVLDPDLVENLPPGFEPAAAEAVTQGTP